MVREIDSGGLTNYNANDQLATDTYDNDGNTTGSNGVGYVYDFENHVIQAGRTGGPDVMSNHGVGAPSRRVCVWGF